MLRHRSAMGFAIAVIALAGVAALRAVGAWVPLELAVYDRFLTARTLAEPGESHVVLVKVGEAEFERYGYPIPHAVFARGIERLSTAAPRAIGIDIYREPPRGSDSGWEAFAAAVEADPAVVLIRRLPDPGEVARELPDFLQEDGRVGFNDIVDDPALVVRRGYLMAWDAADEGFFSLGLQLARLYLAPEGLEMDADPDDPLAFRLGGTTLPPVGPNDGGYRDVDARGYQVLLDYARHAEGFPAFGLSDVLAGAVPDSALRDRILVIGTDAPSVKDDFSAPFTKSENVKGMEIHAHLADQLVRVGLGESRPIRVLPEVIELAWLALCGLLAALAALRVRHIGGLLGVAVVGAAAIFVAGFASLQSGVWLPVVPAFVAWLGSGGLVLGWVSQLDRVEKRAAMEFFRRFISRKVADELWRRRDEFMDGGRARPQRLTLTALLSDLKGYTEASEKLAPTDLMHWINSYMDAMTVVIEAHGGQVDDYVGDGIKVNFGVPFPSESAAAIEADARRAVACALAMGEELARMNERWREQGLPSGRQRIGIHTGPAVVGSIGSADRLKYTSVGDTVNTAARLEGFSAPGNDFEDEDALFRILVSDATRAQLGDAFQVECIGDHRVKGKGQPVRIHRVWGPAGD